MCSATVCSAVVWVVVMPAASLPSRTHLAEVINTLPTHSIAGTALLCLGDECTTCLFCLPSLFHDLPNAGSI